MTAREYALKLLAARGYSIRNLRRKLIQRGYEASDVDAVLHRLEEGGLVDDAGFAREYARRALDGGASPRRVELQLRAKGIAGDTARLAIARVVDEDQVDVARSLEATARKKHTSLAGIEPAVRRRRLFAFLVRRGFDVDDVNRILREVDGGSGKGAED